MITILGIKFNKNNLTDISSIICEHDVEIPNNYAECNNKYLIYCLIIYTDSNDIDIVSLKLKNKLLACRLATEEEIGFIPLYPYYYVYKDNKLTMTNKTTLDNYTTSNSCSIRINISYQDMMYNTNYNPKIVMGLLEQYPDVYMWEWFYNAPNDYLSNLNNLPEIEEDWYIDNDNKLNEIIMNSIQRNNKTFLSIVDFTSVNRTIIKRTNTSLKFKTNVTYGVIMHIIQSYHNHINS